MKKNTATHSLHLYFFIICIVVLLSSGVSSCTKETSASTTGDNYISIEDFYSKNGVALQHYTIDAASGGSFTTTQGTKVTIAPAVFEDLSGNIVSGNVDIEFKDIYKKSDMLLSDMATSYYGRPLKSGGEFFIKATQNNNLLQITPGKRIDVALPLNSEPVDTSMMPFIGVADSTAINWNLLDSIPSASLTPSISNYIFSLYEFGTPLSKGTWCNCDDPSFFAAYPQTTLTLHGNDDAEIFHTDVFLVFKNVNSMIHVYRAAENDYPYVYAPEGLECTVVATGIKDGNLFSSFTPVTVGLNQTINFTLNETTTDAFKTQLETLDD
ncbi:hypothetical protein BH10BAC2_BH10BAC2_47220 [soil metagenome]